MDLLKPVVRHLTFDYFLRRDGYRIEPFVNELAGSQFRSADEIRDLQFKKLLRLLSFCRDHNKYYRERFQQAGFDPSAIKTLEDVTTVPVLTKDDIRSAGDELFSDGYSRGNTMHNRTGGSTGVPLHTYMDIPAVSFKKAATLRHNTWANLTPGDRLAAVWGDTEKRQPLRARIRNRLTDRAIYLDTLKFDEAHLARFVAEIRRYRPPVMMGHAHSIYRFAEYVKSQSITDVSFQGIITTAMVLSEVERKTIESVFNSPVFNRYGCEELSIIASECEAHEGMHVCAEGLFVEVADETEHQPGRIIITDLVNYAMPMIRYEIGDYAFTQPGICGCGRGLPRFKEVVGRTADFLYTPEKKPVFGISILDTFVIHIPGLKQVQIVQDRFEHMDFYVVRDISFSETTLSLLRKNITDIFGRQMQADIHFVEQIAQTERGKYRFSICNIPTEQLP
ncbi:capsule biosynthesis protein CapK [candidate division GN15 bacterium]|uniref:Capsule biosynthesis protein CapK n=1 Tax=candidate division GN15 bacterium TaxID=2072418 RepID=A0A855XCZ5_9BACT|nr:MAG: capsule biosynthesis protein CapK [candidate division GN15 bacterium]